MRKPRQFIASLRVRLLLVTLVAIALAIALFGALLNGLFRDHVTQQFQTSLTAQLDQLTARLEFDADGQPIIDGAALHDPRWQRPYSGLYWQIDQVSLTEPARHGVLRSRSLWDTQLMLDSDALPGGSIHVHEGNGPQGSSLLILERTVRSTEKPDADWRLIVAADLQDTHHAIERFNGVLTLSLALLAGLFIIAALAQVALGLSPLRKLQTALLAVRAGDAPRLLGHFPSEIQPLVDEFNTVLHNNEAIIVRARTQTGNLAHALKTPLSIMAQAAQSSSGELASLVTEQVALSSRQIDWHLARARVAAAHRIPGVRTPIANVIDALVRVMQRVHAHRHVQFSRSTCPPDWAFAGEEQDLQEMLGNLLDNAFKWANSRIHVQTQHQAGRITITLEDDGPGILPAQREAALARGMRLDESAPGSGLGLAIASDLVRLYDGQIHLDQSPLGGLKASLELPSPT